MAKTPETPASAPSETPTRLVSQLRTTFDIQWRKFDSSLPIGKELSSKYQEMKAGYDSLKGDLMKIADDEVLKKDATIQGKLDDFLRKVARELTDENRDKQYDGILTETQSQVSALRSQIYGKTPDIVPTSDAPNPALLAVGGVGAAALASGSALDMGKVAEGAQKSVQEATKGFRGWVAEKVKEPGMMGDIFRDLEKKATSWVKDLTTPPTGSWIDSPWEHMKFQLKKWFAPLLAGWFGISLDGGKPTEATPGQKPEEKTENQTPQQKIEEQKSIRLEQSNRISNHLIRRDPDNKNAYSSWLDAGRQGIIDSTWGSEKKKQKDELISMAGQVLAYPDIRKRNFDDLLKYKTSKTPGKDMGLSLKDKEEQGLSLAISALSFNESWMDSHMKNTKPNWKKETLGDILDTFYTTVGFDKVHNIQGAIKGIDWSGDMNALNSRLSDAFLQIKDGKITGLLASNIDQYKDSGIDVIAIQRIFKTDQGKNTVSDFREQTLKNNPFDNTQSQALFTEITKKGGFSTDIISMMKSFGFSDSQVSTFNSGELLTVQELTTLYLLTGGKTDISKMSPGQRTEIYMALYGLIGVRNPGETTGSTIIDIIKGTDNIYMKEALGFVGTQINETTYIATLTAMGVAKASIDMFMRIREESPKTFYLVTGGIIASVIVGVYLRRPIITAGLIATIIASGASIAGLTVATST